MQTHTEIKFEAVLKDVYHAALKPLGFKKKESNFYIETNGIGKIINIQKSTSNTKDNIRFTINTGIFLPEYWTIYYNFFNTPVPKFPTNLNA